MEIRTLNYILIAISFLLVVNLFSPLKNISGNVVDDLGCEINGNYVQDFHVCCSEMSKFSSCFNGECISDNYKVSSEVEVLNYCKERGYNVRF